MESLDGHGVPQVQVGAPRVLSEVERIDRLGLLSATLNFGRSVGRAALEFRAAKHTLQVELEVFPTKLDYATDFVAITREVADASRALGLEYLRATFMRGGTQLAEEQSGLEWLALVRNRIDEIQRSLLFISKHPHRSLELTPEPVRAELLRRITPGILRQLGRRSDTAKSVDVPGIGRVAASVVGHRNRESLDTPEHAFLAHHLRLISRRLARIHHELQGEVLRRKAQSESATIRAELAQVESLIQRLQHLQSLDIIAATSRSVPSGPPSLTLLNAAGYRTCYQAVMSLSLGLSLTGDEVVFSHKDLHDLYEIWCFLSMAKLVSRISGVSFSPEESVVASSDSIRVRLGAGRQSALQFSLGSRRIRLLYNPTYAGLTGEQRPDIVVEIIEEGWPRIIVALDAKYRLQSDESYVRTFGSPGPPIEAVNALHRYRDAIVLASSGAKGRPTVKGVALFPLPAALATTFTTGRLFRAIDELGIGALPFTPSVINHVERWLTDLLVASVDELALAGPPFLAWEHSRAKTS